MFLYLCVCERELVTAVRLVYSVHIALIVHMCVGLFVVYVWVQVSALCMRVCRC